MLVLDLAFVTGSLIRTHFEVGNPLQDEKTATEEKQDLPALKSIEQHIKSGLLHDGEITDEYFLTQIEIGSPAMA